MNQPAKVSRRKAAHKMTIELTDEQYETLRTANYMLRVTKVDLVGEAITKHYAEFAPRASQDGEPAK